MNLRDLRYFIALADTRHFGKAADLCFVSQPTLSTQVKKLEEELGVALFERVPRNILLTPVGERILKHARLALAQISLMQDIAKHTQDPETASIRLGIFPTLAPYLLPHIIPNIRKRFPSLELLLTPSGSSFMGIGPRSPAGPPLGRLSWDPRTSWKPWASITRWPLR